MFGISCIDGLSEHNALHLFMNYALTSSKQYAMLIKIYGEGGYNSINFQLENFSQDYSFSFPSWYLGSNWLLFINILLKLANKFIPTIGITTFSSSSCFSRDLKRLRKKKKRLFRIARKNDSPDN